MKRMSIIDENDVCWHCFDYYLLMIKSIFVKILIKFKQKACHNISTICMVHE